MHDLFRRATGVAPRTATILALLLFGAVCVRLFLSFLPRGLWEDGYFIIRYAFNTWNHGVMAWNPVDGPLYGMTSQLHQLLMVLLYPVAPNHVVTTSKIVAVLSLFGGYFHLARLPGDPEARTARLVLPFLGLSLALVANHLTTGLETLLVLPWLGVWLHQYLEFRAGRSGIWVMSLLMLGTYLLRPDAVLIPLIALLPCLREQPARAVKVYAASLAGLLVCLAVFKLYYGTALPLPFYIKTYATVRQSPEQMTMFFNEKLKNMLQFAYFFAPFILVTLVARHRMGLVLLASGLGFAGYHAVGTTEIMGHLSRFYIPAVVPILAAAVVSWPAFRQRRPAWLVLLFLLLWAGSFTYLKAIDKASRVYIFVEPAYEIPYVLAVTLFLLPVARLEKYLAACAIAAVFVGVHVNYKVKSLEISNDRAILLEQIEPRMVFRGIVPLERLDPAHVYHTDMGAPGVLFLDAKVTDLDGLLNEEMVLEGKTFTELCERDRPDAIFFPNDNYRYLRQEMRQSDCFKGYRPIPETRLYVRKDLVKRYHEAARAVKAGE